MMRILLPAALAVTLMLLTGCAAPAQIVQINPGLYSLSVGALGIEGGEAAARNKALTAASNYCADQGHQLSVQNIGDKGPVEWGAPLLETLQWSSDAPGEDGICGPGRCSDGTERMH
jgi:putative hemolysin